jgi:hypothetical protein
MPRRELSGQPSVARTRMWRAMRMLRVWRMGELLELTSVRRKAAERYLAVLTRGGYVAAEGGRGCRGRSYRLVRDTGPFAPRAGDRGAIFDPNIEIAAERKRAERLLAELRRSHARLKRLGAFVESIPSELTGEMEERR